MFCGISRIMHKPGKITNRSMGTSLWATWLVHGRFKYLRRSTSASGGRKVVTNSFTNWKQHMFEVYPLDPFGKRLHSYWKSPSLIGKSTINGPLSIAMLNYQRVPWFTQNKSPLLQDDFNAKRKNDLRSTQLFPDPRVSFGKLILHVGR